MVIVFFPKGRNWYWGRYTEEYLNTFLLHRLIVYKNKIQYGTSVKIKKGVQD